MRDLLGLGFVQYRQMSESLLVQFKEATGYQLPPDYAYFLQFREPPDMRLCFKFIKSDTKEEWEGVVHEFLEIAPHADDLTGLPNRLLPPSCIPGRVLFPIACDAGDNYIYLDLSRTTAPVLEIDYASGVVSQVAEDFSAFLDLLYPSDF